MVWDPKLYMKFGAERTRPAAELLSRIFVETPKRVADLGCGPGNSTELLVARWPQADINGIDSSPEMLKDAQASGVKAKWELADVAAWQPKEAFDVVYSNATLQWVPGHPKLLPRLMNAVAENGVFAFQVPRNFGAPSHQILYALAKEEKWAAKLANTGERAGALEPDEYYSILEPHARHIDIWETSYLQVMEGENAVYNWISGTGLRPFANALQGDAREAFLTEYRRRLNEAYPMRKSGKTLFAFQRLFAVATR
jgi:trans-aconitate 2-methyltransferase